MSRPEQTTTTGTGRKEETWTDTIQGAITTTSNALHHAVGAISGETQGNTGSSATYSTHPGTSATGTSSAVESHPFVSGHSSTTGGYSTGGTSDSNTGGTFGTTTSDKYTPATGVTGVPSSTSSAPNPTPGYNSSSTGDSYTTGMNTEPHHTGLQYDSSGNNSGYTSSGPMGSYGHDSNLVEHNTSSSTSARDPVTSRGETSRNYSSQSHSGQDSYNQGQSTHSQSRSTQDQTGTPTLTDKPSHTSNQHSDPSPNPSGPMQGGTDSSQLNSKDPSSSLPPPQTKGQGSATSRGDAPETTDKSASNQRQVNQGNPIGSTSDASSRLKGTQESGPVSMSGEGTSHPGAGATPAAGAGAPVGDPSSGQAGKTGKQGGDNPLQEPPKSKEDMEDEGTGQKYVKSSGVAAQGGDFDASKPGAGTEANRLMGKDGRPSTQDGHSTEPREPHEKNQFEEHKEEKPSLGQKIKGALHKG